MAATVACMLTLRVYNMINFNIRVYQQGVVYRCQLASSQRSGSKKLETKEPCAAPHALRSAHGSCPRWPRAPTWPPRRASPLHLVLQPLRRRPDEDGAVVGDDALANAAAPPAGAVSAIYKGSLVLDIY